MFENVAKAGEKNRVKPPADDLSRENPCAKLQLNRIMRDQTCATHESDHFTQFFNLPTHEL